MSKALKCDRCGEYFDYFTIEKDTSIVTTGDILFKSLYGFTDRNFECSHDAIFHLCPDCQQKLESFLSGNDIVCVRTED